MNAHGIEITDLVEGDVVIVEDGLGYQDERIVVRVVDADGALGGLVDTKALDGRYSRSNGFRAGNEIVGVVTLHETAHADEPDPDCGRCQAAHDKAARS